MAYDLARIIRAQRNRRGREIVLRPRPVPRRLEAEIAEVSLGIVRAWREEVTAILEAAETTNAQDAARFTDDIATVRRLLQGAGSKAGQLLVALDPLIAAWALKVERWHTDGWERSIQAGAKVSVAGLLEPLAQSERIATFRAWAASLIRDLNSELERKVSSLVFSAAAEQTPRRKLAKQLRATLGISRRRALTIARDQTTKLAASLDEARNLEAGIEEYRWRHSGKRDFRPEHKARDGKEFRWDRPPSDGHPGYAINCGCTSEAIIRWDDDED